MPQPGVSIATITTPITVVAVHGNGGGGFRFSMVATHAADYKAVLPRAEVVIEPEWNHFPMLDATSAYATRIASLAHALA